MASILQIWNMALAEVPASRLDSPDDVSPSAEALRDAYLPSVEYLLEDHGYDFAIERARLAVVANDRDQEWDYAYQLPSNMASPRHLLAYSGNSGGRVVYSWIGPARSLEAATPMRIAGGKLYANIEAATLEYVINNPSEARFTARFTRALALELASRVVMPIKQDRKRQGELVTLAEAARERAKADDMNRDQESLRDFIPEVLLARMGYGADL